MISGRRRSVIFFTVLGICLVALAVTLNVSWIVLNWRRGVLAILGVIFFLLIIAGLVLNTIFLVREIRRNEQHDSFINAVTHELKTPVASIRLYLQTLQTRELDADKRREFYRIMLEDSDRLLHTIDQVLRAGSAGSRLRPRRPVARRSRRDHPRVGGAGAARASTSRSEALAYDERRAGRLARWCSATPTSCKAAVWNLLDNAVKYSPADGPDPGAARGDSTDDRAGRAGGDHGVGISPRRAEAHLPPLLPRFRRRAPVRAKGSGLGLFIVRSVARQARRPGVRRERRHRPGQHLHAAAAARRRGA